MSRRRTWAVRALAVVLATLGLVEARADEPGGLAEPVFPEPGLPNPKMRFGTGQVVRGQPELFPSAPDLPGPPSAWTVVQWKKTEVLKPDRMEPVSAAPIDPLLGRAAYAFKTITGESELAIFKSAGRFVYQLAARGGWIDAAGGSNLFLQARPVRSDVTFDHLITYSLRLKLTEAEARAAKPAALQNGAVLAQVISGFSVSFRDPGGGPTIPAFLQIEHADSRGVPAAYQSCASHNGTPHIVSTRHLESQTWLPFAADPGTPQRFTYDLTRYLCDLLARDLMCRAPDGSSTHFTFPQAAYDLRNWTMRGMYLGLETEDTDLRPIASTRAKQGDVSVAVQIADLSVRQSELSESAGCGSR